MLVLTRKLKEQIRIGDDITVTILRISGSAVRVGIEAPGAVRVLRAELPVFGQEDEPSTPSTPVQVSAEVPSARNTSGVASRGCGGEAGLGPLARHRRATTAPLPAQRRANRLDGSLESRLDERASDLRTPGGGRPFPADHALSLDRIVHRG